MKDFTFGTLVACLFLAFLAGFVTCHKIYSTNFESMSRVK